MFGWGKGKDIYSSILDVYPQLIDANGKFDKSLAETIINTRTMSDESKSALQNIINLAQQAEDAYNELNDYMTGIFGSLGESMTDALVNAFSNGTDAAQSFIDSVSDMLETLAKQMVYSVTLAPLMEKAQKEMMDVMQNNGLSDEQKFNKWTGILNTLVDDAVSQQGLANRLLEEYQQVAKDKGFDIFKPEASQQQEATRGGFETMSQDIATELNGRFTALQIAGEEIKQQSIITNDWLRRIYDDIASNTEIPDLAQQSKDITMESYRSQVNINFPTSQLDAIALDVSVLKIQFPNTGCSNRGLGECRGNDNKCRENIQR